MSETVEVVIPIPQGDIREAITACLAEADFNAFEETAHELKAYADSATFSEAMLQDLAHSFNINYQINIIPKQNWNALWESNFEPLVVNDFASGAPWVGVRASFHPPTANVVFDLEITPKMSFGTGHHATTYAVMQLMGQLDFKNKTVFDFGTGTGILAILAEKLGAISVVAVDNDEWCIENASENIEMNQCAHITVQLADKVLNNQQFDITIANINRHILLENMTALAASLKNEGILIMSGLLIEDEHDMIVAAQKVGFVHQQTHTRGNWIAMRLIRSEAQ